MNDDRAESGSRADMMSDERWREIDRVFADALDRPEEQRRAFLDEACGGDDQLRASVLRLLDAESKADDLLGESATDFARPLYAALAGADDVEPALPAGSRVGSYRIVREIGRGGMGSVYLAERADGEFEQRVALKVVKRGMDTDDVLLRFRYERQILATLQHPNIARLLDGGVTEDGRPYLVLELVEGEPIDRYSDANLLTVEQRLDLLALVCDAVQHAHQNLVIHRDLKPSNILITADGTPKLLDFGIAKLLDDSPADAPRTRTGMRILTPEYAAPEQLRGEPVTTAMDVYALGVVLTSLLTGLRPGDASRANDTDREPERPSAIVARTTDAATLAGIAAARSTTPDRLRRRLLGDVDTIAVTALAPTPARRYGSALQLAADIRRHRAELPIAAQPDSAWYRTRKFLRRHRLGAGIAAMLLALLAGFAGVITVAQAATAEQRDRAQRERDKANQIAAFLTGMLSSADPSQARGDTLDVYELLGRGRERIDTALAGQPEVRAEILHVLGTAYASLGDYKSARSLLGDALAARRRQLGPRDPDVAQTAFQLGGVLTSMAQYAAAESAYTSALAIRRARGGDTDPEIARTLHGLGQVHYWKGDHAGAADHFDRALVAMRSGPVDSLLLAALLGDFAELRRAQGRLDDAERMLREGLAIRRTRLGGDHPLTASSTSSLATLLRDQRRLPEAEALFGEALRTRRRILGVEHPDYAKSVVGLAYTYEFGGKYAAAESLFREGLQINLKRHGPRHPEIGFDLAALGKVLYATGSFSESERAYRSSLEILEAALGRDHIRVTMPLVGLAKVLDARGRASEALPLLERSLPMRLRTFGPHHNLTAEAEEALGRSLLNLGRFAAAEPHLSRAEAVLSKSATTDSTRLSNLRSQLAAVRERTARSTAR